MLYSFLEHNGHPLTEGGHFIAYRGVTEDFKDMHTRTFNNSPGSVCEMPREEVDDNPNNTCSTGLHVASFKYASDFGPKVVEVKINPKDVVAVPVDYNGIKMREETVYGVDKTEQQIVNEIEDDDTDMDWYDSYYDSYDYDDGFDDDDNGGW